jgi:hypothetical protein
MIFEFESNYDRIWVEKHDEKYYFIRLWDEEENTENSILFTKPKLIEMAKAILKELGENDNE